MLAPILNIPTTVVGGLGWASVPNLKQPEGFWRGFFLKVFFFPLE